MESVNRSIRRRHSVHGGRGHLPQNLSWPHSLWRQLPWYAKSAFIGSPACAVSSCLWSAICDPVCLDAGNVRQGFGKRKNMVSYGRRRRPRVENAECDAEINNDEDGAEEEEQVCEDTSQDDETDETDESFISPGPVQS